MNYKHLGKYHYIYRLYYDSMFVAHLEKFPIVYSNKRYIYIKEPGCYELKRLILNKFSPYQSADVITEFTDGSKERIKKRVGENYARGYGTPTFWFLLDDISQVQTYVADLPSPSSFAKYYYIEELSRLKSQKYGLENNIKRVDYKIANMELELEKLEENT